VLVVACAEIFWLLSERSGTGGMTPENVRCAIWVGTFAVAVYFPVCFLGDTLIGARWKRPT